MRTHRIAVIPGDGVGQEVIPQGLRVVREAAQLFGFQVDIEMFPWGSDYYHQNSVMMAADAIETLRSFDAIYLGAVGTPGIPDAITVGSMLLPLRKAFDLYVNYRPIQLFEGVSTPIKGKGPAEIDFVCIRENTEGEYAQVGGRIYPGTPDEVAMQTAVFTRRGVERVVRYAFELAQRRRKKLASISKANAQQYSGVLWDDVVKEVAKEYPDVQVWHVLIDAATIYFITQPESFDVVVASNLFGDILTDLGGAIQGGLGLAASGNFNPGKKPAMFEPVHGSAPNIAGQNIANPLGAISSAVLMLEWLEEKEAANLVLSAVKQVLKEGKVRTPDLGGTSKTSEMGDAVLGALRTLTSAKS